MDKVGFRKNLESDKDIVSKVKAVNSRITKAASVERAFSVDLDDIVKDDTLMEELLQRIKATDKNGAKGNAIRKYYKFKNGNKYED